MGIFFESYTLVSVFILNKILQQNSSGARSAYIAMPLPLYFLKIVSKQQYNRS